MKKLQCLFFAMCLSIVPLLQSCDNNDGYSLGDFSPPEWATVHTTGNSFYLDSDDWGKLWPTNTNMGWYEPVDGQRVLTVFNPLSDEVAGYDHAVQILRIYNALTKSVETITPENEKDFGNDPVLINKGDISISGGYMNIIFIQNLPADTKHRISLVQRVEDTDKSLINTDGYAHLELRYNDFDDLTGYRAYGLVSFNLSKLDITSETKGIKLKLNSEVNGEVEVTFDFKQLTGGNTAGANNYDFSKMQLK